jgi:6-phosphofructokinase 2
MIHTLTVNPALDLTYLIPEVKIDDKIRASTVFRAPGGNGINVSRVAARLGHPTVAMGFAGGRAGDEMIELLEAEGIRTWFTRQHATTRTNVILQDSSNKQIRVSSPGEAVTPAEVATLSGNIFQLRQPDFLVIAGGLLQGMPDDFYLQLIETAHAQGMKVVADVDRELADVVKAGIKLIKPNHYELSRLTSESVATISDACQASKIALTMGVETVICSLAAQGAILVREDEAYLATPPKIKVDSAVGAGDSLLAGALVALAEGRSWAEVLRLGVACGTATATTPGTNLCYKETIDDIYARVRIEPL